MQDFNKAFAQQRNAISAPGLKHGSVMKSNNTRPPPCPCFHIVGDKQQWEPSQHLLVQSSPAAENMPGFNLPAADSFNLKVSLCFPFFLCDMNQKNNCFLIEQHTVVMVIYNVQTCFKNFSFWDKFLVRNEKFIPE